MTGSWKRSRRGYSGNARYCCSVRTHHPTTTTAVLLLLLLLGKIPLLPMVLTRHLGSGESGKSTIVKQMKIIHQNGYTVDELALYRLTVYKNLVDCAKALVGAMHQFGIEFGDPRNNDYADYVMDYQVDPDPHAPLDAMFGEAITSIWKDTSILAVMDHQSEFYLMDSAP